MALGPKSPSRDPTSAPFRRFRTCRPVGVARTHYAIDAHLTTHRIQHQLSMQRVWVSRAFARGSPFVRGKCASHVSMASSKGRTRLGRQRRGCAERRRLGERPGPRQFALPHRAHVHRASGATGPIRRTTCLEPPGAGCIDNPTLSPVGPLFMTFNSVDLHGLHGAGIRLQERQPPFSHNCATREAGRVRVRAERTIAAQSPAR